LCGQFLAPQEGGKAKWTPFATVRTSSYEQWNGGASATYCRHSGIQWEGNPDLSPSLKLRLEALRGAGSQ
jgi:hypothetical protein